MPTKVGAHNQKGGFVYRIAKHFSFAASHQLQHLPEGHRCKRLHGHTYMVEMILAGELNEDGFVVDFTDLGEVGAWIKDTLDHQHLNAVLAFAPTSELIAKHIYGAWKPRFPELACVRLSESPTSWAEYAEQ